MFLNKKDINTYYMSGSRGSGFCNKAKPFGPCGIPGGLIFEFFFSTPEKPALYIEDNKPIYDDNKAVYTRKCSDKWVSTQKEICEGSLDFAIDAVQ